MYLSYIIIVFVKKEHFYILMDLPFPPLPTGFIHAIKQMHKACYLLSKLLNERHLR